MPDCVAFLRGINLGGRRITSADLRARFEELGFDEVRTFRASGNVVFRADREPTDALAARIEAGLADSLGYEVLTFLRTADEVRAIAAREPFDPALIERSAGKLQVSLLAAAPPARARDEVLALASEEDRLAFGECELYWLPSGGILDTALDLEAIDELLGPSTRRTKATIELLAAKHFAPPR